MPKKGIVLPLGSSGEIDDYYIWTQAVIFINGYFYLYYTAFDVDKYRVALAISKDGINFIKKGVVLPLGSVGQSDETYTYNPSIIFINNYFYLYYSASDGTKRRSALAISKDGINFIKKGIIVPTGTPGTADDNYTYFPSVIFVNGYYYLYYSSEDGSKDRVSLAISKNGINFVKKGVVIPLGAAGESDVSRAYAQSIVFVNGYFYLYYSAEISSKFRIALAISKDGINFVKKGVVIPLGQGGESDDFYAYTPSVFFINNYFYCYYTAYDGSRTRTALALSKDGINFV